VAKIGPSSASAMQAGSNGKARPAIRSSFFIQATFSRRMRGNLELDILDGGFDLHHGDGE
jgi:hypothetical protein